MSQSQILKPASPPAKPAAKPAAPKTGKLRTARSPIEVLSFAAMSVVWVLFAQAAITQLSPYLTIAVFSAVITFVGTVLVAWRGSHWEPPFPHLHTPAWYRVK